MVAQAATLSFVLQSLMPNHCEKLNCTSEKSCNSYIGTPWGYYTSLSLVCNHSDDAREIKILGGNGTIPTEVGHLHALEKLELFSYGKGWKCLQGTLPTELGHLLRLEEFVLRGNMLEGRLPQTLGRLTNLNHLSFGDNLIHGTLIPEIGHMQSLAFLDGSHNHLQGTLPPELGRLTNLEFLMLERNADLYGDLPTMLGTLARLRLLSLYGNQFVGGIPSEWSRLQRVENIFLQGNPLGGSLPQFFGSMTSLLEFLCKSCSLIGSIPTEIGYSTTLHRLSVSNNSITRELPSELGLLRSLKSVTATNNFITGSIPSEIGKASAMNELFFLSNSLQGAVPAEVGSLFKVRHMALQKCRLQGSLPSSLGRLRQLLGMSLSSNRLKGSIPTEMNGNEWLHVVSLADNSLQGSVPKLPPYIHELALHNNMLTGTLHDFCEGRRFSALLLHGNDFGGHVPTLDFMAPVSEKLLTLHENRLSCKLPNELTEDGLKSYDSPRSSILLGNAIAGPLPEWIPEDEDDPILYVSKQGALKLMLTLIAGVFFYTCVLCCIFRGEVLKVVRLASSRSQASSVLEVHRTIGKQFVKIALLDLFCLFPAYWFGAHYFECPSFPWGFSQLGGSKFSEICIGVAFILHFYLIAEMILSFPTREERSHSYRVHWCFTFPGFIVVALFFSIPSSLYALLSALPKNSSVQNAFKRLKGNVVPFDIAYSLLPGLSILLHNIAFQPAVSLYSRQFSLNPLELFWLGRMLSFWIFPLCTLAAMHIDCGGWWRYFWIVCDPSDTSHGHFDFNSESMLVSGDLLRTDQLCEISSIRQWMSARCGRTLAHGISELLIRKLAIEAVFKPALEMISLKVGYGNRKGVMGTSNRLSRGVSWFELSMIWGPVTPTLQVILVLDFLMNFLSLKIAMLGLNMTFNDQDCDVRGSLACIKRSLALTACVGFLGVFGISYHAKLWTTPPLFIVPLAVLICAYHYRKQKITNVGSADPIVEIQMSWS